jgi:hypothetical protein
VRFAVRPGGEVVARRGHQIFTPLGSLGHSEIA